MNEKFEKIFIESLGLGEDFEVTEDLKPGDIQEWDSMGNLTLIGNLEEQFGIEFSFDDLMNISNVGSLKEVIRRMVEG
ncbi:acyl carrier protein [Butyrivibrio sp. MB2005]|uniref:acyl carrier protein n=1 Tax=Butyrivibrio sp. MB2005 TaxID=1280678 RepID=UPI0004206869|nr:acyl carrier protein [Butyrivibrio sp. MB2005]